MQQVWYRKLDYMTLLAWAALVAVGLVAIYSITHGPASEYLGAAVRDNFRRQLMWAGLCLMGLAVTLCLPVRFFQQAAYPIYGITVLGCLATVFVGVEVGGAQAWLDVGPVRLQVSELAKIGTVLAVAKLLASRRPGEEKTLRYGLAATGLILLPAILVVLQNDLGTALVFFGLIPIMLFWSGLPLATVLLVVSPALAGYLAIVYMPAAIVFAVLFAAWMYWRTRERYMAGLATLFTGGAAVIVAFALANLLQPYQVARIRSFTNPDAPQYRQGVGFSLVQSKAAIGSGGLWGKGFMEGTQTQGSYIPEQSTDFIFSVIGEEFGFIGGLVLLTLFGVLLTRLIWMGTEMKHPFGSMVAAGAAGVYLLHIFINIGMVTGMLPVIGIPLPFISYGGSALLANTAMLAIALDLHMRRGDFSIYGY